MNPSNRLCGDLKQGTCYIPAGSVPIAVHVGRQESKNSLKPKVSAISNKNDNESNNSPKITVSKTDLPIVQHREFEDYAERASQYKKFENLFAEAERKIVSAVNVKSTPPLHQKVMGQHTADPTSALTKIQLILVLQKLQSIGVNYSLLSQFFNSVLGQDGFFPSILVFDDQTLKDSNSCYASALAAINKTRTTDYYPLNDAVQGLLNIVAVFK